MIVFIIATLILAFNEKSKYNKTDKTYILVL